MLPSALLGIRGSDFTARDEDDAAFDALGLISSMASVAEASPSIKKAKMLQEASAASAAEAQEASRNDEIKKLKFEVDCLKSRLETQTKRHQEAHDQQEQRYAEAKDLAETLEANRDELKATLEGVQAQMGDMEAAAREKEAALAAQIDRVQAENTEFASKLEEIANAKNQVCQDLDAVRQQLAEATATVEGAEAAEAAAVEARTTQLQAAVDTANDATAAAEARAQEMQQEVERLSGVVEANEATNAELMSTFEETVGQLEESTVAQNDLAEKLEAAQNELAQLKQSQVGWWALLVGVLRETRLSPTRNVFMLRAAKCIVNCWCCRDVL